MFNAKSILMSVAVGGAALALAASAQAKTISLVDPTQGATYTTPSAQNVYFVPAVALTSGHEGDLSISDAIGSSTYTFTASNGSPYHFGSLNSGVTLTYSYSVVAAPEPASWALMIMGVGGVGFALRRKNAKNAKAALAV